MREREIEEKGQGIVQLGPFMNDFVVKGGRVIPFWVEKKELQILMLIPNTN